MKKLLTTTAVLTVAMAGAASAQSVLERVLAETAAINSVTGIFANTADNVGAGDALTTSYSVSLTDAEAAVLGFSAGPTAGADTYTLSADQYNALNLAAAYVEVPNNSAINRTTGVVISQAEYDALSAAEKAAYTQNTSGATIHALQSDPSTTITAAQKTTLDGITVDDFTAATAVGATAGTIDGSISIVANRIDEATANVDNQVTAISDVTVNFGNMATTVLGAVNTGEIGLGTNQEVEEAIADTSQAVRSVVNQVGTDVNSTVLAMNSALNTMNIDGSIDINLDGVNASVASVSPDQLNIISEAGSVQLAGLDQLLGTMSTTVLGAVNTGTIVSGVNNQVDGTVAGIVGNSATNMFGATATQ